MSRFVYVIVVQHPFQLVALLVRRYLGYDHRPSLFLRRRRQSRRALHLGTICDDVSICPSHLDLDGHIATVDCVSQLIVPLCCRNIYQ